MLRCSPNPIFWGIDERDKVFSNTPETAYPLVKYKCPDDQSRICILVSKFMHDDDGGEGVEERGGGCLWNTLMCLQVDIAPTTTGRDTMFSSQENTNNA